VSDVMQSGTATLDVEAHRAELTGYCYRMLGSTFDADDAVQETMVRAWQAAGSFEGRSSVRSWLYRIATNVCLDSLRSRQRRALPMDLSAPVPSSTPPEKMLPETTWIEPIPDADLDPAERAVAQDTIRIAFIAALQHLPPKQRAVLILREVLGFSAKEVGETLETSVPSVNSALQRARKTVGERLPEQSQQATLRALGDARMREIVEEYMEAMRTGDVDRVVSMLAEEDAAWSMPPLASWYGGLAEIEVFLRRGPLSGDWRWRHAPGSANGQLAVGTYTWIEGEQTHIPFSLDVLSLEGEKIKEITAFVVRTADTPDGYSRWPEYAADASRVQAVFKRFGLPDRMD
jgi:RNA polymerase sigma-70 factor, ECF subfamily